MAVTHASSVLCKQSADAHLPPEPDVILLVNNEHVLLMVLCYDQRRSQQKKSVGSSFKITQKNW
jgi:hypothetical protein